jgi:hypothetical protein
MNDTALARVSRMPSLTKVGDRKVSLLGFRVHLAIEHLQDHLVSKNPWCDIGCMARTMFGRNTESNRARIRRSVRLVFKALLDQRVFLVISYDPTNHGRIEAMKLYQGGGHETEHAMLQLRRMLKRKQLTDDLFQSARALVSNGVVRSG